MDHSVDKELVGWSHSRSCGQWLDVQVKASDKCFSGSVLVLMLFNTLSVTWTVGSTPPSASLSVTPNCVVWLAHWREGMPSRRTLTGLRGGCELHEVQQGQVQGTPPKLREFQTQIQAGQRKDHKELQRKGLRAVG